MRPVRKRALVDDLREGYGVSQRRACRLVLMRRSSYQHRLTRDGQVALRLRINEIARVRVRYGYKRIYVLLRREGWLVNHKWVYRIYCEEGLNLRAKRPKRRVSAAHRERKPPALGANEHWSMDFVTDSLCNGRRFRCLTAVDNYSRECLAIEVGQHNRGEGVVHVMSRITAERGVPRSIHVDNGPEFTAKAVRKWLARLVLSCCRPTACHCCCTVLPALASLSPIFRRVGGLC